MDLLPYVLGAILLVFLSLQLRVIFAGRRLQGRPVGQLPGALNARVERGETVLLYFFSPTCPPCRAMTPLIDRLAAHYPQVVKVDISEDQETPQCLGIMATPTVVLIRDRQVAKVLLGGRSERQLVSLLQS